MHPCRHHRGTKYAAVDLPGLLPRARCRFALSRVDSAKHESASFVVEAARPSGRLVSELLRAGCPVRSMGYCMKYCAKCGIRG